MIIWESVQTLPNKFGCLQVFVDTFVLCVQRCKFHRVVMFAENMQEKFKALICLHILTTFIWKKNDISKVFLNDVGNRPSPGVDDYEIVSCIIRIIRCWWQRGRCWWGQWISWEAIFPQPSWESLKIFIKGLKWGENFKFGQMQTFNWRPILTCGNIGTLECLCDELFSDFCKSPAYGALDVL